MIVLGVSIKYICVFENTVHEIPLTKVKDGKMEAPIFSNQSVLKMEMVYETKNRKPNKILRIIFNNILFNSDGIYDYGAASVSKEFQVKLEYIMSGIGLESSPLPIPIAPVIPSNKEVELLKNHLNNKYPLLLFNSPYALEEAINQSKVQHQEDVVKMKDTHRD